MLISYKQQERLRQHLLLATCVCWVTLLLFEAWAHEPNQSFWVVFHPFLQTHHKCWICPNQKGRYLWRYKCWEILERVSCDFCIENMAVQITLWTTKSFFPHTAHQYWAIFLIPATSQKIQLLIIRLIKPRKWVLWEMRKQIQFMINLERECFKKVSENNFFLHCLLQSCKVATF